jgi:chaperonin GroEL
LDRSWGAPTVTKDGVSVAKEVELENRFANLGAQMVKEVASRTADLAGDGTTTATILAQAIYSAGAKLVAAGANPMDLKRGIDAAVEVVISDLARQSIPVAGRTEVTQIGIISANGDETIGNLLAEAMEKVGKEGVVTIEEGKSMETTLEVVEGMQFDHGYLSPYFVTDVERMEAVLGDAFVLLYERKLTRMQELLPLLELVAGAGKPLLIVAEDIGGEALATLVVNKLRGALQVCAVKAPGFGDRRREMLQDIAALVGGRAITEDLGVDPRNLTLEDLGRAKSVTIGKDTTTFREGAGTKDGIRARAQQIRARMDDTTSDYDRDKLQERLARVSGGIAVIRVGGVTESEMKARKARVEDALHATRAATEEGVVPGGGVALLRTLPALDMLARTLDGDRRYGVNVLRRAIEEPLRQLAQNGGAEGAVVVGKVCEGQGAFGYNVAAGVYEDLVAAGIIDPTKVVRVALQNAASVASLMLTTEALVVAHIPPV